MRDVKHPDFVEFYNKIRKPMTRKGFIRKFLKHYIPRTNMPYLCALDEANYYADGCDSDYYCPTECADEAISVLVNL